MDDIALSPYKGFHISVKAVPMRQLEAQWECSLPDGYVVLVQICRGCETVVDWCLPYPHGPWETPDQAKCEGLAYASRIVDVHLVPAEASSGGVRQAFG
jgi:hypothetical protein